MAAVVHPHPKHRSYVPPSSTLRTAISTLTTGRPASARIRNSAVVETMALDWHRRLGCVQVATGCCLPTLFIVNVPPLLYILSHAVGAQHTLAHGCWRCMLIVTQRTCLGYIDVLPSMFFSLPAFYGDDIDFPQRRTVFTWVCASAPDLVSQFSHEEDHVIADCRLSFVLSQYSN